MWLKTKNKRVEEEYKLFVILMLHRRSKIKDKPVFYTGVITMMMWKQKGMESNKTTLWFGKRKKKGSSIFVLRRPFNNYHGTMGMMSTIIAYTSQEPPCDDPKIIIIK